MIIIIIKIIKIKSKINNNNMNFLRSQLVSLKILKFKK